MDSKKQNQETGFWERLRVADKSEISSANSQNRIRSPKSKKKAKQPQKMSAWQIFSLSIMILVCIALVASSIIPYL